jgi:hypothetical protein
MKKLQERAKALTTSAVRVERHIVDYGKPDNNKTYAHLAKIEIGELRRKLEELDKLLDAHLAAEC